MPVMIRIVGRIVRWREGRKDTQCFDDSRLPKLWEAYAELVNSAEGQRKGQSNAGRLEGTEGTSSSGNQTPQ